MCFVPLFFCVVATAAHALCGLVDVCGTPRVAGQHPQGSRLSVQLSVHAALRLAVVPYI